MKYTDYYYERIDIEAFRVNMESWRKEFNEADSVEVQSNIIQKVDEFEREYASYQAIASLNYNRNINDEDAKSEKEYFDSIGPQASEISNGFNQDLVDSKFRKELEEKLQKKGIKKPISWVFLVAARRIPQCQLVMLRPSYRYKEYYINKQNKNQYTSSLYKKKKNPRQTTGAYLRL